MKNQFTYYPEDYTAEYFDGYTYFVNFWDEGSLELDFQEQTCLEEHSLKLSLDGDTLVFKGTEAHAHYCTKWDFEFHIYTSTLKRALAKLSGT